MATNIHGVEQFESSGSWQLDQSGDIGIIDRYSAETLSIGGATMNIFKLLGVHEQGSLIDLTGEGIPISGGTATGSSMKNAFESSCTPWRSEQKGVESIIGDAYIGYNFGVPKLSNGRDNYGVNVDVKHHITTIRIKQSEDPNRRTTRARVERSDDGIKWIGVALIDILDNNELNEISFSQSATTRYWRLRPIQFTGTDTDFWEVETLELVDWAATNLFQVQDEFAWIENRDRDYASGSLPIKGYYDLYEKETDLTQFGFTTTGGLVYITCNFNDVVHRLGRPVVIGDIMELPNEAQYDPLMSKVLKYLEITDVSWSAEGFAPGWQPTLLRVIAEPMLAKQETMDIVGDMVGSIDKSGLVNLDDSKYSTLATDMSERGREKAEKEMPLRGSDTGEIKTYSAEEVEEYSTISDILKTSVNQVGLYMEDGLPPNGDPYTEDSTFPINPIDKAYHRMTYGGLADQIPPRLYRYSSAKSRWVFLESDLRFEYDPTKPTIQRHKDSVNSIPLRNLGK